MQKQYALNKQLTFIISMQSVVRSFVRFFVGLFDCVTVVKITSNQRVLQSEGKDMQRRIQNPTKHLRWSFLLK